MSDEERALADEQRNGQWADMARIFGPRLIVWARAQTRHDGDAWDLVQDAFERALRKRPTVSSQEGLFHWLLKVARNRNVDRCRAAVNRLATHVDLEMLPAPPPQEPALWHRIESATLHACIRELPPALREPLLLTLEGHPGEEIARRLRILPGTVGTRTFRARHQLRVILQRKLGADGEPQAKRQAPPQRRRRGRAVAR